MKIALLSAVAVAAAAFSGVAYADAIVSETLTGIITGGSDSGPQGANDDAGLFGGGNLYGVAVTVTFSYDIDLLVEAALGMADGSTYYLQPDEYEYFIDYNGDGAVTEDVTIGGMTYTASNDFDPEAYLYIGEIYNTSPTNSYGQLQVVAEQFLNVNNQNLASVIYSQFSGGVTSSIPLGELGDQAALDAYIAGVTGGTISLGSNVCGGFGCTTSSNTASDVLTATFSTPEPAAWGLAAMGLAGLALIKRHRRAKR
jgi:MYXO-CTERM domain-containing protein